MRFNVKLRGKKLLRFQYQKRKKKDAVYMQLQQHPRRISRSDRNSQHKYKTHPASLEAGQSLTRNK